MSKKNKIYTHDEAALIVEMFEDVLDEHDITIPSPEDDDRTADNDAKLYSAAISSCEKLIVAPREVVCS